MPLDTRNAFQWTPTGARLVARKNCPKCREGGLKGVKLNVSDGGNMTTRQPVPCTCARVYLPTDTPEQIDQLKQELDEHYAEARLCTCLWCELRKKIIEEKKKNGEPVPK